MQDSVLDHEGSVPAIGKRKKRTKRDVSSKEDGSRGANEAKRQRTEEEKIMRKQRKKKRKAEALLGSNAAASLAELIDSAAQVCYTCANHHTCHVHHPLSTQNCGSKSHIVSEFLLHNEKQCAKQSSTMLLKLGQSSQVVHMLLMTYHQHCR